MTNPINCGIKDINKSIIMNIDTTNITAAISKSKYAGYKTDLGEILRLRYHNNFSLGDIAAKLHCSKTAILRRIKTFEKILKSPEEIQGYRDFKAHIFDSVELELLEAIMNKEKITKGSINNLGYVFQQIFQANRLTQGLATSNIELHVEIKSLEEKITEARQFLSTNPA